MPGGDASLERRESVHRCQRAPGGYEHDRREIYGREPGVQGGRDISAPGEEMRGRQGMSAMSNISIIGILVKKKKRERKEIETMAG